MGAAMARRLMQAGHELAVTTRTRSKAEALLKEGASWVDGAEALWAHAGLVCIMPGLPSEVEALCFGDHGLIAKMPEGGLLVDFSTSDPALSRRIAEAARERGGDALDAPVSGGDVGAREGSLSIMVGGSESGCARMAPLFEVMGKQWVRQGDAGAGQLCKLVNQTAIAGMMSGLGEALLLAERSGLDPATVLESISGGAAGSWAMSHLAPRILQGDMAPGFAVRHFVKDLRLAAGAAESAGLNLAGLKQTLASYAALEAEGGGELGTQAIIKQLG